MTQTFKALLSDPNSNLKLRIQDDQVFCADNPVGTAEGTRYTIHCPHYTSQLIVKSCPQLNRHYINDIYCFSLRGPKDIEEAENRPTTDTIRRSLNSDRFKDLHEFTIFQLRKVRTPNIAVWLLVRQDHDKSTIKLDTAAKSFFSKISVHSCKQFKGSVVQQLECGEHCERNNVESSNGQKRTSSTAGFQSRNHSAKRVKVTPTSSPSSESWYQDESSDSSLPSPTPELPDTLVENNELISASLPCVMGLNTEVQANLLRNAPLDASAAEIGFLLRLLSHSSTSGSNSPDYSSGEESLFMEEQIPQDPGEKDRVLEQLDSDMPDSKCDMDQHFELLLKTVSISQLDDETEVSKHQLQIEQAPAYAKFSRVTH